MSPTPGQTLWRVYRCARGLEPPELAQALLTGTGKYQPDYPIDIWAFGQLILTLIHAQLPRDHQEKQACEAFKQGLEHMSEDSRKVSGLLDHLKYLAKLQGNHEYAEQVRHNLGRSAYIYIHINSMCLVLASQMLPSSLPEVLISCACATARLNVDKCTAHRTTSLLGSVFASQTCIMAWHL